MARIAIGIDGGGSGCRVAVARDGLRIADAQGGPANIHTDPDAALANVRDAVAAATAGLSAAEHAAAGICAGLAGARDGCAAQAFASRYPRPIRVVDDSITTLMGALGDGDGVVASLGTGSFFAAQSGGRRRVIGGWGFVLGDEGSAAWLGRAAIARALAAEDGRQPGDALTAAVAAHLQPWGGALRFAAGARPGDHAQVARLVLAHRDTATGRVLVAAALSEVAAGLRDAGHLPGTPLVMMGTLGEALAPHLPEALRADLARPLGTALDGALALARYEGNPS